MEEANKISRIDQDATKTVEKSIPNFLSKKQNHKLHQYISPQLPNQKLEVRVGETPNEEVEQIELPTNQRKQISQVISTLLSLWWTL